MRDIWGFLLQTLTVTGAAALVLGVKALLRDKLFPRWQFAAWCALLPVLLLPAGLGGRYVLLNWPLAVESVKTLLTGDYTMTHVTAPIPLPMGHSPETAADWLFLLYALGVLALLVIHLGAYVRLRLVLRKGKRASEEVQSRIKAVAVRYDLASCPAVAVPGLPSAFVCGLVRPVLALPADGETDDKVLLHELLHLNHHDTLWSVVICLFRCLHWCNPVLWFCANQAGNDLEALCDQRVLEKLEGEERRDYGRILLSMANEQYARATGTTSMANGGRNIRQRIEAIARFKRYPAGMGLVSLCVVLVLTAALTIGSKASAVSSRLSDGSFLASGGEMQDALLDLRLSEARAVRCTTAAGALDTYGKALLTENGFYRVMCLPEAEQAAFADELKRNHLPTWDQGLDVRPWQDACYVVLNLEPVGDDAYEGLMVVRQWFEDDMQSNRMKVGLQNVRTELENGRWIVRPLEEVRTEMLEETWLRYGSAELPAYHYSAKGADFLVETAYQQVFVVDNDIVENTPVSMILGNSVRFNMVPQPGAEFYQAYHSQWKRCTYLGSDPDSITKLGLSVQAMAEGEERPDLHVPYYDPQHYAGASGTAPGGGSWYSYPMEPGWGPVIDMGGGGGGGDVDGNESFLLPASFAADLYINHELAAQLTLLPEEGGAK